MKRTVLLAAAYAMFTGPLLAQPPVPAREFVKEAAMSDMLEIEASQLVAPTADADTRPFADRMIKDHTNTSNELKALVQSGKVKAELPTQLDAEHQKKMDDLKKLTGTELDASYDKLQVEAHQEAVQLFTNYAQTGDDPELKQWAAKILPDLKEHLSMARKLK